MVMYQIKHLQLWICLITLLEQPLVILNKKVSKKGLVQYILDSLHNGKLRILSKDSLGNFLDCNAASYS